LNFTLNRTFGEDGRSSVNVKIANILNDRRESLFQAFEANEQVFNRLNPGTTVSIGYTYRFF
jgi:hypothetical protein